MVKSRPNMNKMAIILRCLMELTERKTKQSKTYASNKLVGLSYYIVTGKIITSSNSLFISKVKFF